MITGPDKLKKYACNCLEEFARILPGISAEQTDLVFTNRPYDQPINARIVHGRFTLYVNPHLLCNISSLALKGWIEQEMAVLWISQDKEFNFSKTILPLFPVSGSAVQFIRRIVAHIETIQMRVSATRLLMGMDRTTAQICYYSFAVSPSTEEAKNYNLLLQHNWSRALFLLNLCEEYAPITLLDTRKLSPGIRSFWWDCRAFLTREDRVTIEALSATAAADSRADHSTQITELFEVVQSRLLI